MFREKARALRASRRCMSYVTNNYTEHPLARRNFGFEKRQKEEARKQKKQEKLQRRQEAKDRPEGADGDAENLDVTEGEAELPPDPAPQADGT
jgi:hypothetical protein